MNNARRVVSLAWGLARWQSSRFAGLALVAMCLTLVFTAADSSYSVARQQIQVSVDSAYRGFRLQIIPDAPTAIPEGAVPIRNDEALLKAGDSAVQVSRTSVGVDSITAHPTAGRFGITVSGRHPAAAGEVSLSEPAAKRLGVSVGDSVEIAGVASRVVGIIVLPTLPTWAAVAAVEAPIVSEPNVWLMDESPPMPVDSGYQSNGANFETMLAYEVLDQGPLGFVRYFRPTFLVLAACLFAFLVMLLHSGVTTERRGMVAAGMPERRASATVSIACALSGGVGILMGWAIVVLALLVQAQPLGRLWGMRWVDVPMRVPPLAIVFGVALVAVALLMPVVSRRRPTDLRTPRRAPLPRWTGWAAMGLCVGAVAMICFPNSRANAGINLWLALAGTALFSIGTPIAFAAATTRAKHRAVSYIARQRSRRGLTAVLLLTVIAFLASLAATHYAHYAELQESWYRPFQPAGSLAVREVTDPGILARLAAANPGAEISTRSDNTGLLVLRPSTAARLSAAIAPIDDGALATADATGICIGQVGEKAEVWTIADRPDEHTVLAAPALIEEGNVVIGRLSAGRFVNLATVRAVPSALLGGGGGFPDAVVSSLARYGGTPNRYWNLALLEFAALSSAEQGRLEGLARSLAPAAFIDVDAGYQDGGVYAFSQLLGCGAAFLVGLITLGLGFQIISEEREVRRAVVRSGRSSARRHLAGVAAFAPVTLAISFASLAALAFTRDTGDRSLPHYGYAPLAFVAAAMVVAAVLGTLYARDPQN